MTEPENNETETTDETADEGAVDPFEAMAAEMGANVDAGYINPEDDEPAQEQAPPKDKPKAEPAKASDQDDDDDDESKPVPLREWTTVRKKRQKLREQEQRIDEKLAAIEAKAAAFEREQDEHRRLAETLARDPMAGLVELARKSGQSPEQIIESLARKNLDDQEPAAILSAVEKLRAEFQQELAAVKQSSAAQAEAVAEARYQSELSQSVDLVTQHIDEYPYLAALPRSQARGELAAAIDRCSRAGVEAGLHDIASYLDNQYGSQYSFLKKAKVASGDDGAATGADNSDGDGQPKLGKKNSITSNDQSSQTTSPRRPTTEKERNLAAEAFYRQAFGDGSE